MTLRPPSRPVGRVIFLAAALLLAALIAVPMSGAALAQAPDTDNDDIRLVNKDRQMVERKKEGEFVARPVFSRQVPVLHYSIRHPDTGEWVTETYRVQGGEKKLSEGWEYTFEYPALDEQPELDPEQAYLLALAVPRIGGGERHVFHALIPVHQPRGLWDRVLGALDPDRWARAAAGWLIQGAHGTLCGVVEGVTGTEVDECGGKARGLMGDILTGTPPNLTYQHEFVQKAWGAVWAVTTGALMVILGWMGLSFIVQEHLGRHQSGWREMVPRLVLGLTAAASSLWWCALVIDVAHAVSQFIAAGWLIQGAHGTLCGVVEGVTGTEVDECGGKARGLMGDILTGTPPNLTYQHEFVQKAWGAVWAVTTGALMVILGWMGLSFIVQEHLGRHQSGWREMVPRLVLGLTAAASSLWWCALVIDVAHAVSQFIAAELEVTPGDLLRAPLDPLLTAVQAANTGLAVFIALLYLVFGFFVLYLLVQMILRLALIDILLCLAPIALGLWILPHTAGWGKHWLRLFMTAVFQQAIQLIAVALAFAFLEEFADITGGEAAQDLVWMLLMAIAFMYLAGRVPSMLGHHGTFDAWLHTLYFGMSLPGSMMRSARSIGLMAGGAAGGPAGMAAATAATGAASAAATAAGAVNSAAQGSTAPAQSGPTPRSQGP